MAQKLHPGPPARPSSPTRACLAATATALLLTGCGHNAPATHPATAGPAASPTWLTTGDPAAQPPAPQLPTSSSVPTAEASGALPGTRTCTDLNTAILEATLMDPGVVTRITAASATADAPVSDAAQRLATAYAKATAAKDTPKEPDAVAAVSAAAADMAGVCAESGLESAG
jgi:hypothetical protein